MAQTTLAVQTVERVSVSEKASRLTSVWSAHALSMYKIFQLEGAGGILPGKFLENSYHKIESRVIFNQMWVQDE